MADIVEMTIVVTCPRFAVVMYYDGRVPVMKQTLRWVTYGENDNGMAAV